MEKKTKDYKSDHMIAKIVIAIIVSVLISVAQFTESKLITLILNISGVFIWIFGINITGYLIETLRGHKHKHEII